VGNQNVEDRQCGVNIQIQFAGNEFSGDAVVSPLFKLPRYVFVGQRNGLRATALGRTSPAAGGGAFENRSSCESISCSHRVVAKR
jgi:hypothetical protein